MDSSRTRLERATPFLIVFLLVVGIGSFVLAGFSGGGGRDGQPQVNGGVNPIESMFPRDGDEVLQQVSVGLDLDAAWEADLVINGTLIPPNQLDGNASTGIYSFTPDSGKVIERLDPDQNCAVGLMHLIRDPTQTSTVRWCFTAS